MKYLFLFIFLFIGSFAYSDICDPLWLQEKTKALTKEEIKNFLQNEAIGDINQICNAYNDQPLYLTLISDSRIILIIALVEAGADLCTENTEGQTPLTIIEERYFDFFADHYIERQFQSNTTLNEEELDLLHKQHNEMQVTRNYIQNMTESRCNIDIQ